MEEDVPWNSIAERAIEEESNIKNKARFRWCKAGHIDMRNLLRKYTVENIPRCIIQASGSQLPILIDLETSNDPPQAAWKLSGVSSKI